MSRFRLTAPVTLRPLGFSCVLPRNGHLPIIWNLLGLGFSSTEQTKINQNPSSATIPGKVQGI